MTLNEWEKKISVPEKEVDNGFACSYKFEPMFTANSTEEHETPYIIE